MKVAGNIGIVFGLSVGVMALGYAMASTSATVLLDLDLFRYANNVTAMSQEIQDDINSKQTTAEFGSYLGIISMVGGIILLIATFRVWRKMKKK